MKIELRKASLSDAEILWKMQKAAFAPLYEIYRDEGSPAMEPLSRTQERLEQSETSYYFILADGAPAGAIRVRDWQGERPKVISPLFVLPDFQGRGIAQRAIRRAEEIHGSPDWLLDTIVTEDKLRHLYEKMGYRDTGKRCPVNEKLTLVLYYKA
mgnify:FL=1